jgi:hypothetical protein
VELVSGECVASVELVSGECVASVELVSGGCVASVELVSGECVASFGRIAERPGKRASASVRYGAYIGSCNR